MASGKKSERAHRDYTEMVPEDVRNDIADQLGTIDYTDTESMLNGFRVLLDALIRGKVPPAIITEARQLMVGATQHRREVDKNKSMQSYGAALLMAIAERGNKRPALEARFTEVEQAQGQILVHPAPGSIFDVNPTDGK